MGGSFLSMMRSNNVAAGASGAIFGIAGIMLVAGYLHRDALHPRWGRIFGGGILPFIVVNLFLGFSIPHIDNWGHLGGLASGMLLAAIIPPPQHQIFPGAVTPQPSQALVVLPLVVVALAMTATAEHYRTYRSVTRLLQAAERLRAAGQHAKALEQIQQALRLDHTDERTHEELGTLYLTEDRLPEAIQAFEEAHRLSPDSPRAQLGLAAAYRRQGDFAKAQALLENVVGKNPHTAEGQQLLADLLAEQKLYPEAIQRYQEALRLNRNYTPAHNNLAWLFATCEDPQFRNPAKALEHARQAVELSGWKEPNYIDTLAEAFYVNGNFHEAVKVQTEALKLDPENPEFLEHMARYRKAAGV
jgi:tetratricopeptide (TPR) repeat protein